MKKINGVEMKDITTSNDDQFLMCPHCKNGKVTPREMTICPSGDRPDIICDESEQKTTQGIDISDGLNNASWVCVYFYCKSCKSYSEMYLTSNCVNDSNAKHEVVYKIVTIDGVPHYSKCHEESFGISFINFNWSRHVPKLGQPKKL